MSTIAARSNAWSVAEIEEIAARHAKGDGPLLPILHDVQAAFGHIPRGAIPIVAEILNISRADIYGVISFYHDFHERPVAKPVIRLCRAEACQARGVDRIAPLLEMDQRVEVEAVYCLGLCASGPSAIIGEQVFARLDETNIGNLVRIAIE